MTMSREQLMYIELKSGYADDGPAWISKVTFSKTGRTAYFNDRALMRFKGNGANFVDIESGEEFWISGVKKNGQNRHWAGSGKVNVDVKVLDEFLRHTRQKQLDTKYFILCEKIVTTNIERIYQLRNPKRVAYD